ncbi:hypothetical protein ES705_24220 [subsurface metagenome]
METPAALLFGGIGVQSYHAFYDLSSWRQSQVLSRDHLAVGQGSRFTAVQMAYNSGCPFQNQEPAVKIKVRGYHRRERTREARRYKNRQRGLRGLRCKRIRLARCKP